MKGKISKKEVGITLGFLKLSREAEPPEYAFDSDAGFDLKSIETVSLFPFEQELKDWNCNRNS